MLRFVFVIALTILTCVAGYLLPYYKALDFFAIVLVLVAGVYIGFAIEDGRPSRIALEGLIAVIFAAIALLGMWRWPLLIPLGYLLHGAWDLLHHPVKLGARVQSWYPPACILYDWLVAIFIYLVMFW